MQKQSYFYTKIRLRLQKYTKIFQRVFGGYAELSFIIRSLSYIILLKQAWHHNLIHRSMAALQPIATKGL